MKTSSSRRAPTASEAPASTKEMPAASSFSNGKEIPSTAASSPSAPGEHVSIATFFIFDDDSPSSSPRVYVWLLAVECGLKGSFSIIITYLSCVMSQPIQAAVTVIRDFASRFTLLQAENARLQQDAQSKSVQLDQAVKIAATARQEADSLKKELG